MPKNFPLPTAFPPIKDAPKYNLTTTRDCYCVWDPMVQTVTCPLGWDEVVNSFFINLLAPAFINIITSAITITKLLKRNAKVHGRKSVITIVLLSISAGFMYVPAPFVGFLMSEFEQFNTDVADGGNVMMNRKAVYEIPMFLVVAFLPQITSALNPIILIVRGSTLQEYSRHLLYVRVLRRKNYRPKRLQRAITNQTTVIKMDGLTTKTAPSREL